MTTLAPHSEDDYEAIADAVMETERGRWFLREFARRNRVADTDEILGALTRLEARLQTPHLAPPDVAPTILPGMERLADLASEIKTALTATKPAEHRVALALEGLAALEGEIQTGPETSEEPHTRALAIAPPEPSEIVSLHAAAAAPWLGITPPLEHEVDLVDVAFHEIDRSVRAIETLPDTVPAAWAKGSDAVPAPAKDAVPARSVQPPLLESLSEVERALLFA